MKNGIIGQKKKKQKKKKKRLTSTNDLHRSTRTSHLTEKWTAVNFEAKKKKKKCF